MVVRWQRQQAVGTLFYGTHSENKLAFLIRLVGVDEYEVDALGNYEM